MSTNNKEARVAIVTGGSRGIGRAIAVTLARQGWDVCVSYLSNAAAANETAAMIREAGARTLTVKADMASRQDIRRLFAETSKAFGRLDALVNNAGVVGGQRSIFDADEEHLRGVFDANVLGAFYCAAEAGTAMSTQKGGRGGSIVNLSSVAARTGGMALEAHYAASKGAIDSLTLALAKELAPHGIRVNAVRPGLIYTEIHASAGEPLRVDRMKQGVPMQRGGDAIEVARAVMWLLSAEASYITGTLLDVSGGR